MSISLDSYTQDRNSGACMSTSTDVERHSVEAASFLEKKNIPKDDVSSKKSSSIACLFRETERCAKCLGIYIVGKKA